MSSFERLVAFRMGMTERNEEILSRIERSSMGLHEEDMQFLLSMVEHSTPEVRIAAIERLGETGSRELVFLLKHRLKDRQIDVRLAAVEALSKQSSDASVAVLLVALGDPNELVRLQAIEALAESEMPVRLEPLAQCLSDKSPLVRSWTAVAMAEILLKMQHLSASGRIEAHQSLRDAMATERSKRAKVGFFAALIMLGEKEHIHQLLGLLDSHSYHIRCAVAESLAQLDLGAEREEVKRQLEAHRRLETKRAVIDSIERTILSLG